MEELSLEELTAQLQAAQEKKAAVRLSERNIVELVNKLKELGFIETPLLHTVNGKEYLTQAQLRQEIQDTLAAAGGRISLSDLCHALNVDLIHCERESAVLVEASLGQMLALQEELITEGYLHNVALEIKERLETTGMLRIGNLAIQYGLSHELLLSVISARLGTVLQGELLNSMLFTQAYLERLKAQLRGALRGTTSPIMISALLKQIQLDDSALSDILMKLIQDLIEDAHIQGELRANGQWVPHVHLKAQWASVVSQFHQTGFVSVSAFEKASVSGNESSFPDHTRLKSVLVAPSFVETIRAEIEEQLEKETWCDVVALVPLDFSGEDAAEILKLCYITEAGKQEQQITDTCLVTPAFIEDCRQRICEMAIQLAKDSLTHSKQKEKLTETSTSGSSKGKADQQEDDDWDTSNEKGKGKKKAKGKNKAKNKSSGPAKPSGKPGKETSVTSSPSAEVLVEQLHQWFSEMEEVAQLAEAIAEKLLPEAAARFRETLEEASRLTDKRRLDMKDRAFKQLEETLNKLWMFGNGIDALQSDLDEATVLLLNKHLIKTTGMEALDWLLRYFQLQEPGADEEIPDEMVPIAANLRSKIIEALPPDVSPVANTALQTMKEDNPESVLESLESGMESCGIRFPKRDKKAEKQRLADFRATWKEALAADSTPATVLALILPLLVAQVKGALISLPGRTMPALMEYLKPLIDSEAHETLISFHRAVVDDLKQKSATETEEEPTSLQETLLELMPRAKALVKD